MCKIIMEVRMIPEVRYRRIFLLKNNIRRQVSSKENSFFFLKLLIDKFTSKDNSWILIYGIIAKKKKINVSKKIAMEHVKI